jgi:hypothetical protein
MVFKPAQAENFLKMALPFLESILRTEEAQMKFLEAFSQVKNFGERFERIEKVALRLERYLDRAEKIPYVEAPVALRGNGVDPDAP